MTINDYIRTLSLQAQNAGLSEEGYFIQQLLQVQAGGSSTVIDGLISAATLNGDLGPAAFFTQMKYNAQNIITLQGGMGSQGATGVSGAAGAMGATGVAGTNGAQGATGVSGVASAAGDANSVQYNGGGGSLAGDSNFTYDGNQVRMNVIDSYGGLKVFGRGGTEASISIQPDNIEDGNSGQWIIYTNGSHLNNSQDFGIYNSAQGDASFVIQAATANVGIGTNNPQSDLDVAGTVHASGDVAFDQNITNPGLSVNTATHTYLLGDVNDTENGTVLSVVDSATAVIVGGNLNISGPYTITDSESEPSIDSNNRYLIAEGENVLAWNPTGVGVGTVSPSLPLEVVGSTGTGIAQFDFGTANEWVRFGTPDAYGRTQIWHTLPGGVIRTGALISDGDPFNAMGNGLVVYGPDAAGDPMDQNHYSIGRATYHEFYLLNYDNGANTKIFSADTSGINTTTDAGAPTFALDRTTGNVDVYGTANHHSNPITNVADPTNPQDAATKNYVDNAGGATGIQGATGVAGIQGATGVGGGSGGSQLTINQTADTSPGTTSTYGFILDDQSQSVFSVGGDLSNAVVYMQSWTNCSLEINKFGNNVAILPNGFEFGQVAIGKATPTAPLDVNGTANFNGNQINDVADPTNAQDVATKNYVDGLTGIFSSTVITGTGSQQSIAHGLGVVPRAVLVSVYNNTSGSQFSVVEGSHDATNLYITVTNNDTYKVLAFS